ncbi:MLO-like protein 12 [Malania oleifera]|uniref:MLO-like protein 12 n=1 Tax=Malania oleifera TaxID=397392 RepID=UPI0025AE1378|nr:MLO-like protein 12 [Malania oleifera]
MASSSSEGGETGSLVETPTWAVATVCFVLISISILMEYLLHLLAKYFHEKKRKALLEALDKVKSELMLMGFISLLLTVSEKPIANICIPKSVGETFLPCSTMGSTDFEEESKCEQQGKVSLLSREGVTQLQYLIFVLAFFHVLSCVLTFSLGMAKMKRWQTWEAETRTLEYQFSNDPRRFKLIHETSFGKRHLGCWSDHRLLRWPACFLRQFYHSVSKVDYFILRHGFIMAHFAEGSNYNFQKYIKRALERDFHVVVGISWWVWIFFILFIFFNAHVFYSYLWLPFIPLVMLLVVGTKLQDIITKMCMDSHDKALVVRGTLLVRPGDHFFWFGRPALLLHLMHFILFQNSFQMAFFAWTWYKFGFRSCFHQETEDIVIRIVLGLLVQILCGYVTLPLHALVTQMGTSMRKDVFTEGVVMGLQKWRANAKKNLFHHRITESARPSLDASVETSPSFSDNLDHTPSPKAEFLSIEVVDDERGREGKSKELRKLGSFEGFDMSKMS